MRPHLTHDLTVALRRRLDAQSQQEGACGRSGVAGVTENRVQALLGGLERFVAAAPAGELLATETAWLEAES